MDKKNPDRAGRGRDYKRLGKSKYKHPKDNVVAFPAQEKVRCIGCGDLFMRLKAESWKRACIYCWRKNKALGYLNFVAAAFKDGES